MDHEKAYIFSQARPSKRRRVEEPKGLDTSWPLRERIYQDLWGKQYRLITEDLNKSNDATLNEIISYLGALREPRTSGTLHAGFVLAGPSIAAHSSFFQQLEQAAGNVLESTFIIASSSDAPNLKTLLKAIIRTGTSQKSLDGDRRRGGRKLLDYDLQLLRNWVNEHDVEQIVIIFRDCEAFDSIVLSEAIELLAISDLPFTLLFGIATSIENLQDRLSQSAARCLHGQQFDVIQSEQILEQIFFRSTVDETCTLRLGAQLSHLLLHRHQQNLLSSQDLIDAVQYAYMSHFYANPLSVFLSEDVKQSDISPEHIEALRNVPSFRTFAEKCLTTAETARQLNLMLENDEAMFQNTKIAVSVIQDAMTYQSQAVQVICKINEVATKDKTLTAASVYIKAMTGQLKDSPLIRELLLVVRKSPSDVLSEIIQGVDLVVPLSHTAALDDLKRRLAELIAQDDSSQPMRSEHDIRNDSLRTTVVAQKVQLSRHKSKLSARDEAYSKIATDFHDMLASLFSHVRSPLNMPAHEIVIYDLRTPHRAALTPKPRFALERALYSSHDYLNCQCCGSVVNGRESDEASLSATLPPTALLYRLYLESGALMNVSDLWSAFNAIMEDGGETDTAKVMPLFQRGLAELKYLGLVKATRKKTDHIAKVAWKGL